MTSFETDSSITVDKNRIDLIVLIVLDHDTVSVLSITKFCRLFIVNRCHNTHWVVINIDIVRIKTILRTVTNFTSLAYQHLLLSHLPFLLLGLFDLIDLIITNVDLL